MARFQTVSDLPASDQAEITRILAIASAQRTTVEANYLTARDPYLYNGIDLPLDEDGNIVMAHGHNLPTSLEGFAKSALFRKTDVASGSKALYENIGDDTSAVWDVLGAVVGTEVQLTDDEAPVNAVNSYAVLTASSVTAGVRASSILTSAGACAPAKYAESVVTANTIVDGDTLTMDSTVYRFKTAPSQAYDVALGANDAEALDNFKLAVNASGVGDGSDYYAGTLVHPTMIATTNTDTTQKVVARTIGTGSNAESTTSTGGNLTWADTTLGGGTGASIAGVATTGATTVIGAKTYTAVTSLAETHGLTAIPNQVLWVTNEATFLDNLKSAVNATTGEGTTYGTGTTANVAVVATTNTDTEQTFEGVITGVSLNSVVTTTALANYSWEDTTLGGATGSSVAGVDGDTADVDDVSYLIVTELSESIGADAVPNEVVFTSDAVCLDNLKSAINGTTGEGTTYATGTEQPTASVSATTNTNTTQNIEADVAGVSGDDTCAVSATGGLSWDDSNLHDGVDGTVGDKGQQYVGTSYIYTAIDDNTIVDKNWRRVSLGVVY